jgi:hypothetical protein
LLAERLAGIEERVRVPAQALQLVLYERALPQQERDHVLREGRKGGLLPVGRARVATWMFALDEIALHATRFPGWPDAVGAGELRKLLVSPTA